MYDDNMFINPPDNPSFIYTPIAEQQENRKKLQGLELPHVSLRLHAASVVWNVGLALEIPTSCIADNAGS